MIDPTIARDLQTHLFRESRRQLRGLRPSDGEWLGERAYKIPMSSTKSMTGHAMGAAGAIEALSTVMTVQHGIIPPTINLNTPDPECDLDYCANAARDMKIDWAVKNNFGFGGTNGTLVFKRA